MLELIDLKAKQEEWLAEKRIHLNQQMVLVDQEIASFQEKKNGIQGSLEEIAEMTTKTTIEKKKLVELVNTPIKKGLPIRPFNNVQCPINSPIRNTFGTTLSPPPVPPKIRRLLPSCSNEFTN